MFNHVLRRNNVPCRLRHLLALPIENKPMGQDSLVWRTMIRDHSGQQCTVKPAPMLIRPFEIEIGRPALPLFQYRGITDARLEPDIENISFLLECRPPTLRTGRTLGQ